MKQVEITLKVNNTLEDSIELLESNDFKMIRKSEVYDIYMTQYFEELKNDNIEYILSKSLLLRYLKENGKEYSKITYKDKAYENNNIISEEKINLNCEDLDTAKKLFTALGFKELIKVKYEVTVMAKDEIEFAFQKVDGLGLLVEYENLNNFEGVSNLQIMAIKQKMKREFEKYGIIVGIDTDISKAKELIIRKYIM